MSNTDLLKVDGSTRDVLKKKNETLKFKHYTQTNKLEEASPKKPKPKSRRAVGTKALANLIRNAKCCFQKVTVNGTQILFYVTQIIDPSY